MELKSTDAEQLALDFFLEDWEIPEDEGDFFVPLDSRGVDERWYVVEIGVEGLPDKWIIQVYDETNLALLMGHSTLWSKIQRLIFQLRLNQSCVLILFFSSVIQAWFFVFCPLCKNH